MDTELHPSEKKMKRPIGVTVIAVWGFVGSTVVLSLSAIQFLDADIDLLPQPFLLSASTAMIVLGIGLWRMKNWARISTAIGTLVGLLIGLAGIVLFPSLQDFSPSRVVTQAIIYAANLSVVVYLLIPSIKRAFLSSPQVTTAEHPKPGN
jgi:peptidoglycan/LPS O-acetylase OafA/YrhL